MRRLFREETVNRRSVVRSSRDRGRSTLLRRDPAFLRGLRGDGTLLGDLRSGRPLTGNRRDRCGSLFGKAGPFADGARFDTTFFAFAAVFTASSCHCPRTYEMSAATSRTSTDTNAAAPATLLARTSRQKR